MIAQIMTGRISARTAGRACAMLAAAMPGALAADPGPQPLLESRSAPTIEQGGLKFRDLDRNGALTPYEDWRLAPAERARDLVVRMTLAEKAGAMMHGTAPPGSLMGTGDRYDLQMARTLIRERGVTSFITRLAAAPGDFAEQNNRLQEIAEGTRLGIPVAISTDPRNHFQDLAGAASAASRFSQWPEPLGLAAIDDEETTRSFADMARQEYRAVGIHIALSPQADLATEPRWPRVTGTFGEDRDRVGRQVGAYVAGFQKGISGLNRESVATVVKHWAGYGAAKNGFDSHSHYGRFATLSGGAFEEHVGPFDHAFKARVASVMPTYSILEGLMVEGRPVEQVGAGFNRWLLTDLLRGRHGFDGVILSDRLITNDCPAECRDGSPPGTAPVVAMPWGVEQLPRLERFAKAIDAGIDQFGGVDDTGIIVEAVGNRRVPESRVDAAVIRILTQKFALGLFEAPYVDPRHADAVVGSAVFREAGLAAQRRSLVVLENRDGLLPLAGAKRKLFLHGIDAGVARAHGFEPVDDPASADLAVIRADAPYQMLHPNHLFGRLFHEGDLDFKPGDLTLAIIERVGKVVPVIATVYLDRPAILTSIRDKASVLIGNFGASDTALFDVLTGKARAEGRLPFELPSSMAAVRAQASDAPHDSADPLYPVNFRRDY